MVLSLDDCVPRIFSVEVLNQLSIERQQCVSILSTPNLCLMDPIVSFITDNVLSSEAKEVEKKRRTSARFWLSKDKRLYRQSFGGPYLLCLHPRDVEGLLTELHGGICGSYGGTMAKHAKGCH